MWWATPTPQYKTSTPARVDRVQMRSGRRCGASRIAAVRTVAVGRMQLCSSASGASSAGAFSSSMSDNRRIAVDTNICHHTDVFRLQQPRGTALHGVLFKKLTHHPPTLDGVVSSRSHKFATTQSCVETHPLYVRPVPLAWPPHHDHSIILHSTPHHVVHWALSFNPDPTAWRVSLH